MTKYLLFKGRNDFKDDDTVFSVERRSKVIIESGTNLEVVIEGLHCNPRTIVREVPGRLNVSSSQGFEDDVPNHRRLTYSSKLFFIIVMFGNP